MNRRRFIARTAAITASAAAFATVPLGATPAPIALTTYRDTGCSCCENWTKVARAAGYRVVLHDLERGERMRRFGLTEATAGCHTTQVAGYLIEGHVPMNVLAKLLRERPKTRGIGIAGMPTGIAGMGGERAASTTVMTLDGTPRVYARV